MQGFLITDVKFFFFWEISTHFEFYRSGNIINMFASSAFVLKVWVAASLPRSITADIFGYFLPLFQTGQRGDHGKMWGSVGAFQPTGSSVPFPDIQVSKSYHMYAQTTEGFPPTFPATVNSVLSRHTRALLTRRVALNNGENVRLFRVMSVCR